MPMGGKEKRERGGEMLEEGEKSRNNRGAPVGGATFNALWKIPSTR
jgi:hypothetical protein